MQCQNLRKLLPGAVTVIVIVFMGLLTMSNIPLSQNSVNGLFSSNKPPRIMSPNIIISPSTSTSTLTRINQTPPTTTTTRTTTTTTAERRMHQRECRKSFMTVSDPGRLGNQMCEYASLLTHSMRLNMTPFVTEPQKKMLSAIFRNIEIQTWEEIEKQGFGSQNDSHDQIHEWVLTNQATPSRVPPWLLSTSQDRVTDMNTCEELFEGTEAYVAKIEGYNVDVKLWPPNLAEIRRHFTPKQEIIDSADTFLRNTSSALHRKDDARSLVMVGVHARRTDYKHHLNVLLGGKLVTKKYFEDAMAHIKEKYRENHVLFVMASDDANWIKSMFNGSDFDVAFTSSAHSSSIEPAHFDMTVLSRCNHTIMSHGSYGLWSAYLAGGDVVVADGYSGHQELSTKAPGTLFTLMAANVMNWTVIWDRCYKRDEGGVLTEECEKNKTKYGIED